MTIETVNKLFEQISGFLKLGEQFKLGITIRSITIKNGEGIIDYTFTPTYNFRRMEGFIND